jgi:hypothetical protein
LVSHQAALITRTETFAIDIPQTAFLGDALAAFPLALAVDLGRALRTVADHACERVIFTLRILHTLERLVLGQL